MNADILLTTINARYTHTSLALRYLKANLLDLEARSAIIEFTIQNRAQDIAEKILQTEAKIVGISVSIWNYQLTQNIVECLKIIAPQITIVLGGPEVSYEYQNDPLVAMADYTVIGEGESAFYHLCKQLLADPLNAGPKIIIANLLTPSQLNLPYHLYTDEDIRNRILYFETSRGCPYRCAFCLSSLSSKVRYFPIEPFLAQLDQLWKRGARIFKFIDRTFNLDMDRCYQILNFFLQRTSEKFFLHFEVMPDRFPDKLIQLLALFPSETLQLEIGVQSLNTRATQAINRLSDNIVTLANIKSLKEKTNAHLHLDLIVGLPLDEEAELADSFNHLISCTPHEIQVGILKRLRGTPLTNMVSQYNLFFSPTPPYEILQHPNFSFMKLQQLKRFARYFEMFYNQSQFITTLPLLWQQESPYQAFLEFSDFFYGLYQQTHQISLDNQAVALYKFLTQIKRHPAELVRSHLEFDYQSKPGRLLPRAIRAPIPPQ